MIAEISMHCVYYCGLYKYDWLWVRWNLCLGVATYHVCL